MSGATHDVALALCALGVGSTVLTTVLAMTVRDVYARLHFLSPATSLGTPLVALSLAVENGWTLTSGQNLLIGGLVALSGPGLTAGIGRVAAQQDRILPEESPQ